jgi:hypothetical protein
VGRTPDSWLKEGEIYTVLAVDSDKDGIKYRILTRKEPTTPALHEAELFSIVNHRMPSTWVVNIHPGRSGQLFLDLAPPPWMADGFWGKYFDHHPNAIQVFERAKERILSQEGNSNPSLN